MTAAVSTRAAAASRTDPTGPILLGAGVTALAANLLHPRFSGADVAVYRQIASSDRYALADTMLLGALLLLTVGFAALARQLRVRSAIADSARITALVGGTLAIAQTGVELQGLRQQARVFAAAADADQVGAFWSTNSLDRLNAALTALWIIVLLGLTPLLLVAAQLQTRSAPRALALLGGTAATICTAVGIVDLLSHDQGAQDTAFLIGSLLLTAWVITTGYTLMRTAKPVDRR